MSNLFRVLKRIGCVLLASLMLITSVSISFDVPKVEAVAPTSYAFFYTFVQYMMAQSGLSMRSTSDNESLAREFSYWMEKQQLETEAQIEFAKAKAITKGEKFYITNYVNLMKYWNKFANRFVNSNSLANYSDGISANDLYDSFISNITNQSFGTFSTYLGSIKYNYASYFTFTYGNTYYLVLNVKSCYPSSNSTVLLDNGSSEFDFSFVEPSPSLEESGTLGYSFYFYKTNAFEKFSFRGASNFSSFYKTNFLYNVSNRTYLNKEFFDKVLNFQFVNLLDSAVHFSDYADIQAMANTSALPKAYGDSSKSSAIPETSVVAGSEDIVRAIQDALSKTDNPTTEDINKIVSDSIASVTGSLSDINDSVDENGNIITNQTNVLTDILTQIRDIKTLMQSRTETDGTSALAPDLDDVSEQFKVIQGGGNTDPDDEEPKIWAPLPFTSVGFLKPLIEYFSQPLSEITKFLKKIKDAVEASKNLLEYIRTHEADILSEVKAWEDSAQKDFQALPSKIWESFKNAFTNEAGEFDFPVEVPQLEEFPEKFRNYFFEHPLTLPVELPSWDALKETFLSIPQEIQDLGTAIREAFGNIKIEVPDSFPLEFPDLLNVNVLNSPAELLQSMKDILSDIANSVSKSVLPDLDALKEVGHSGADKINNHFGLNKFQVVFNDLSLIPKNEYPVIKIQAPAIIVPFLDKGTTELTLFDGSKFKDYFSFFRNILKAMIIVTYFYAVLRKFRVSFSM